MLHVDEHPVGIVNDVARTNTFNMGDKTDAAVFVFVIWIIQTLFFRISAELSQKLIVLIHHRPSPTTVSRRAEGLDRPPGSVVL